MPEANALSQIIDRAISPRRLITLLLGLFSLLALFLASLGIYGVIAYSVSRLAKVMKGSVAQISRFALNSGEHIKISPAALDKRIVKFVDGLRRLAHPPCMARKLRVQYPGAIYHVMDRGDHLEIIFRDSEDPQLFLQTLDEACTRTDWQVHCFCLMSNHFHLVIETPRANLADGMKWLLGTYTSRFNRKHKLFGHLFSGRYKAKPVDGSCTGYLKSVCDYVHLNPSRVGLLTPEQPLQHYRWSSYPLYLLGPQRRPPWLRVDRLLGDWGIPMDSAAGREQFARHMEARRKAEQTGDFSALPHGWCIGSEQFRQELLLQMSTVQGSKFAGPEWKETAEKKAERILAEELGRRGWEAKQLAQLRKADPEKLRSPGACAPRPR